MKPGAYICPVIPKKSVSFHGIPRKKSVGFHGIPTEKKKGFQNWELGVYSHSVWDSKIDVGFQKIYIGFYRDFKDIG